MHTKRVLLLLEIIRFSRKKGAVMKKNNAITIIILYPLLITHLTWPGYPDNSTHDPDSWKKELAWNWKKINPQDTSFPKEFLWGISTEKPDLDQIEKLKDCGFKTCTIRIPWKLLEPQQNEFNDVLLEQYETFCQKLLPDIEPIICLYHDTLPLPPWFIEKGSFEKQENIQYFVAFAQHVFEHLKSVAPMWVTFNAPDAYAMKGYVQGYQKNLQKAVDVLKNMLEAHVQVYHRLKNQSPKPKIGIVKNVFQLEPQDRIARTACTMARAIKDDPFFEFFKTGSIHVQILSSRLLSWVLSRCTNLSISASLSHTNENAPKALDFIGISYFSHAHMRGASPVADSTRKPTDDEFFTVYPEGLYRAIQEVSRLLASSKRIPIHVSENGIDTSDPEIRRRFFRGYLYALSRTLKEGYPVKGYSYWSLNDSTEEQRKRSNGLFSENLTPKEGTEKFLELVRAH